MPRFLLAIDQGTTSTRALLFDEAGAAVATSRRELAQHYPADGWVEHEPERLLADALDAVREALAGRAVSDVAAVGLTNQRETVVLWERASGRALHRAL